MDLDDASAEPEDVEVAPELVWTDEQLAALDQVMDWAEDPGAPAFLALTGFGGTGKTTVLRELARRLGGRSVAWTAMTGRAALRVRQVVGVGATTLHSALYQPPEEREGGDPEFVALATPSCDLLVIDEASMVTPQIYADLQSWARGEAGMPVVVLLVGDPFQLPPVLDEREEREHGGRGFTVFAHVHGPTLTRVMRSETEIAEVAAQLRQHRTLPRAPRLGYEYRRCTYVRAEVIEDYLADPNDHALITWRNDLRMEVNQAIRQRLGIQGDAPQPGEPIIARRNGAGVLNGERLVVADAEPGPQLGKVATLRVSLRGGGKLLACAQGHKRPMDGGFPYLKDRGDWLDYVRARDHLWRSRREGPPVPITYGHALTCHLAQGSEYRRVTVFLTQRDLSNPYFRAATTLPDGESVPFSTRWGYTAITRARQCVSVLIG